MNTSNGYLSSNNAGTVNNDLFLLFYVNKPTEFVFLFSLLRGDNTATQSSYYCLSLIIQIKMCWSIVITNQKLPI